MPAPAMREMNTEAPSKGPPHCGEDGGERGGGPGGRGAGKAGANHAGDENRDPIKGAAPPRARMGGVGRGGAGGKLREGGEAGANHAGEMKTKTPSQGPPHCGPKGVGREGRAGGGGGEQKGGVGRCQSSGR